MPTPPRTSSARQRQRQEWRQADSETRQNLIIESAIDLLHRKGLGSVTMRGVAQALGVGTMTLYTYVKGQEELRCAMTRRGFEMLQAGCAASSTLDSHQSWKGGARHYVQFALENPRLYELMFATPLPVNGEDESMLMSGFKPLFDRIRQRLSAKGIKGRKAELQARRAAGVFWVSLHGLASLAIAGRLAVLERSVDNILADLLDRVAPG